MTRTLPEYVLEGNTPDIFCFTLVSPRVTDWESRDLVPLVFRCERRLVINSGGQTRGYRL
jgi:hypothetical protein